MHVKNNETVATKLAAFDHAVQNAPPAKRTYSGKPGCACGCRGTYRDATAANVKAMYTRMRRTIEKDPATEMFLDATYIWVETETRVNSVRFE